MEQVNISCDVYLDLILLVRNKVASDDSNALVYEHIENCENCKAELTNINIIYENTLDDIRIIKSIKKNLLLIGFAFIIFGTLIGVYISNSIDMFYNIIIMPIVGALSYLILNNKWYLTSFGIFLLSYVWIFIQSIFEGALSNGLNIEIFSIPIALSIIYSGLTILGVTIAVLLEFVFKKEV